MDMHKLDLAVQENEPLSVFSLKVHEIRTNLGFSASIAQSIIRGSIQSRHSVL
jgi:hypothetical protein